MTCRAEGTNERISAYNIMKTLMDGYAKCYFEVNALDYQQTCQDIADLCEKAIFYYHPTGRTPDKQPHIHGLVVGYSKTAETLRNMMKKRHKLDKTSQYSVAKEFGPRGQKKTKMTEENYHKYLVYMTKGQYDPVLSKGFLQEEYLLAKSLFKEQEAPIIVEAIHQLESKPKKKTLFQMSLLAEEKYMRTFGIDAPLEPNELREIIADTLQDNASLAHFRNVANIYQDIMYSRHNDQWHQSIAKMCGYST